MLQPIPVASRWLQVTKDREAQNMYQNIKAHHHSVQTYVQRTIFKDPRNKKEAQALARALDLFVDQYGDHQIGMVDCLEALPENGGHHLSRLERRYGYSSPDRGSARTHGGSPPKHDPGSEEGSEDVEEARAEHKQLGKRRCNTSSHP